MLRRVISGERGNVPPHLISFEINVVDIESNGQNKLRLILIEISFFHFEISLFIFIYIGQPPPHLEWTGEGRVVAQGGGHYLVHPNEPHKGPPELNMSIKFWPNPIKLDC